MTLAFPIFNFKASLLQASVIRQGDLKLITKNSVQNWFTSYVSLHKSHADVNKNLILVEKQIFYKVRSHLSSKVTDKV